MDNNKHNDWTGAVRERLEGRELTPSDALWERIGAAVPQADAPHKVRRLAWGGAIGAAAAAAIAAILFLRPAGTREDAGRIEVVPTAAAPIAEQRVIAEQDAVTETAAATETQSVVAEMPSTTIKMVEVPTLIEEVPSNAEAIEVTNVQPKVEEYTQPTVASVTKTDSGTVSSMAATEKHVDADEKAMSLEDYLNVEEKKRKPVRRLTAAVYAAGMVSTNALISNDLPVMQGDYKFSNDAKPGASLGSSTGFVSADSGISYNPETPLESNHFQYYTNSPGPDMNHSRPVSAGVALSLPLNDHLFLESGLYYSYLHSTSHAVSDQSLHFVGIPVKAGWRMGMSRRTSLSFSAGAKAEKCILALRDGQRFKEPGIQLAAVGSAAFQYDFTSHVGIFLAPELSYWFTKTELPTYNTENPFNLSLKAGINLTVGN
ncbi:MAG: hypothetical protein IKO24_01405 [Bacteroidales bacterium]|nr:hypothetical protein [Bacteroidales bacterium]